VNLSGLERRYRTLESRFEKQLQTISDRAVKATDFDRRVREIEAEVRERWPVKKVKILHREGSLPVGEISVAVAVSSEHREEAFEACRFAIGTVKHSLPVWKREKIVGGGELWVEGEPIREARTRATPSRESARKQVA